MPGATKVKHCRCVSIRGEVRRDDGWFYCGGCGGRIGDGGSWNTVAEHHAQATVQQVGLFAAGCTDCGSVEGTPHVVGCLWDDSGADVPLEELDSDLEGQSFVALGSTLLREVRDAA